MIRQIDCVAEDHPGTCDCARIPTKSDSHRLGELRIVELGDRLIAERERFSEPRHQLRLRPGRLHRIRSSGILGCPRSLQRAKVVAEEVIVARDVLRDESDTQLRRGRLVGEFRLGNGIESLRNVAMQRRDPGAKRGGDRIGRRCSGRLLGGEGDRRHERQNREMRQSHTYPCRHGEGLYSARELRFAQLMPASAPFS